MSVLKRLPWVSLSLLLVAYFTFGKFVMATEPSWATFIMAIAWGLVLAIVMRQPLSGLRQLLVKWFKSDTVAFTSLLAAAMFVSILLNWFKLFLPVFMILAAESLARLDLQTAELSENQAFVILTLIAWLGLGLGWLAATYI